MAVNYNVNPLGGFNLGAGIGQVFNAYQQGQEKEKLEAQRERLQQAALGAAKGDPQAIEELFALDPNMAMLFEKRQAQMSAQDAAAKNQAFTDWGLKYAAAKTPEEKQALEQEALSNPMIDFDESDMALTQGQKDLVVNAALYKNLGKDAYGEFFGTTSRGGKTAAIQNYEYFTSVINDPAATKQQKDNARRQLGEIGRAGALPSSVSYQGQDFILNPADNKYYSALDNKTLEEVQKQEASAVGQKEEAKGIAQERNKLRSDAIKKISTAQSKMNSYDEAIDLIDRGASTQAYAKLAPTLTTATSMLESVRNSLALDTLSGVSLGALSEGELKVLQ